MKIWLLVLLLLPVAVSAFCILEAVDCEWIPPDATWDECITKMLWVTNTGDEVCDSSSLRLALAAWGLWLNWEDAASYPLPFVCPGDTVLIVMQEMRACNEEYYRDVDWLNPLFIDHYDFVEAPADSGVCDTFYIGNPTTEIITVNVTIDSVVGTDWDVVVFPTVFSLAPGDSQAISICTEYTGWDDTDTIGYDSLLWAGGGAQSFISAEALDSLGVPIDMVDAQLRHGRFRYYTCLMPWLPDIYEEYVSLTQETSIMGADYPFYKNWIIRMNNAYPFENNVDLTGYWWGADKRLENVSFRAAVPANPYTVTYPSDAKLLHSSFTDASGDGDSEAALNIAGTADFYAKQLLVQNTHGSVAMKLESPFHIDGLVIKDADGGLKIFNDGLIEDFSFEGITGSVVDLLGGFDLDIIASQVEPDDANVYGSGTISFYSRGRILVEDTLGEKLENVAFTVFWGTETSYSGFTNEYGSHSPFPIKWAEIKAGLTEEDKDVRFLLEHADFIDIDTVITIGGVKDWLRFTMVPAAGIGEKTPSRFEVAIRPNPFNGTVAIYTPTGSNIEIFDINGRLLTAWSNTLNDRVIWRPDEGVTSGLYLLRARFEDKEIIKRAMYLK